MVPTGLLPSLLARPPVCYFNLLFLSIFEEERKREEDEDEEEEEDQSSSENVFSSSLF
jgi:hypothetical protein